MKEAWVRDMFGRIARRYDLMNRVMTLGRDRAWRRYSVSQLAPALHDGASPDPGAPLVLDVATGTGDLALETLRQHPSACVVGLDLVPEMLALAQPKAAASGEPGPGDRVPASFFLAGDALRLPFPDGIFDGVATGFALRNVTDIPAAFAEMARVTRPGGRVVCLEIAKPSAPLFRHLFALYFFRIVPLIGGWISGTMASLPIRTSTTTRP